MKKKNARVSCLFYIFFFSTQGVKKKKSLKGGLMEKKKHPTCSISEFLSSD